jgi:hypothetical protein
LSSMSVNIHAAQRLVSSAYGATQAPSPAYF